MYIIHIAGMVFCVGKEFYVIQILELFYVEIIIFPVIFDGQTPLGVLEVGQVIDVHLMPEEAYGQADSNAIFTMEIAQLPGSEDLTVGQQVYLSNQYGQPFPVKVTAKDEKNITFDANHEMAGKELNFKIELVEVK